MGKDEKKEPEYHAMSVAQSFRPAIVRGSGEKAEELTVEQALVKIMNDLEELKAGLLR